ncbi:MAG: aminoacyl-tRNA hydrolase [Anaerolineae bacterium]|nr:aminoacyl-tRNA hydrolase [Anaerolineae bacterium]
MLTITPGFALDDKEIQESFIRASGPGGQNVNKTATAVQLRFDARQSPSLTDPVRERLLRLAGSRAKADGVITIQARRHRTQEQNREDARERLADLIRRALEPPKPRRVTKVSRAAQARRVDDKKKRGRLKALRHAANDD